MADVVSTHVYTWSTETCQSHLKKQEGKREKNRCANQGAMYVHKEMSQGTPMYN
jgi:hypothetical protein